MANVFGSQLHRRTCVAALAGLACSLAWGQPVFPSKPIRMIVPAAAGSAADIIARLLGERLSSRLGQPVVVENRPGAGGSIGAAAVSTAQGDGHTLLFTANNFVISPHLYGNVPYDIYKDFSPLGLVATGRDAIFVHPSLGVSSLSELIALARSSTTPVNYGAPFLGSAAHLIMESLARISGMKLLFIPASGAAQSFNEALAGRVPVVIGTDSIGEGHVKTGRLKALAVVGQRRSAFLPETPTLDEIGFGEVNLPLWFALYGPAGLPREAGERLAAVLQEVVRSDGFAQAMSTRGYSARHGGPAELQSAMRMDDQVFSRTIREAGIKP